MAAEELMTAIPTPAERLPIFGVLAVYYGLRKDPTKPRTLIASLLAASKQINGALPRFNALAAAAEPMLSAGLNDMARAVFEEALQLITLIDDPAERVRCLLHLVKLKEIRRDAVHSTTRTIAFAGRPATHLLDMLRQALFAARQLRNDRDKLECFETMATRVLGGLPARPGNRKCSTPSATIQTRRRSLLGSARGWYNHRRRLKKWSGRPGLTFGRDAQTTFN